METTLKPIAALLVARSAAMARRDALALARDATFAKLRRGARAAEDDGAEGLFAALFGTTSKPKKKAKPAPAA